MGLGYRARARESKGALGFVLHRCALVETSVRSSGQLVIIMCELQLPPFLSVLEMSSGCRAHIHYMMSVCGVVSKSFESGTGPQSCLKGEVSSSVMSLSGQV